MAEGGVNPSGKLRIGLDLYANPRLAKCRAGFPSVARNMDLLIARENTEGFHADRNMASGSGAFMPVEGVGLAMRKTTGPPTAMCGPFTLGKPAPAPAGRASHI